MTSPSSMTSIPIIDETSPPPSPSISSGWGLPSALTDWAGGLDSGFPEEATDDGGGGGAAGGGGGSSAEVVHVGSTESGAASDAELDELMGGGSESAPSTALFPGFAGLVSGSSAAGAEETDLSASDAEQAAMEKQMESGLSSMFSGFLGGGITDDSGGSGGGGGVASETSDAPSFANDASAGLTSVFAGFGFGFGSSAATTVEEEGGGGGEEHKANEGGGEETMVSSAIWSAIEGVSEGRIPGGARIIGEWIEGLEKEESDKDPHRNLRESLDEYLNTQPRDGGAYEDWVEAYLVNVEGWDEGSAVVDDTFYLEKSAHRIVWNERNTVDGIGIKEGEERTNTRRKYVPVIDLDADANTDAAKGTTNQR